MPDDDDDDDDHSARPKSGSSTLSKRLTPRRPRPRIFPPFLQLLRFPARCFLLFAIPFLSTPDSFCRAFFDAKISTLSPLRAFPAPAFSSSSSACGSGLAVNRDDDDGARGGGRSGRSPVGPSGLTNLSHKSAGGPRAERRLPLAAHVRQPVLTSQSPDSLPPGPSVHRINRHVRSRT